MSLVEVRRLSRSFGPVHAVRDVSFAFEAGSIYGFIGPNGAGKSTTMRILATLDLPTTGDCFVAGRSTVDDADAVRRLIGYMPDTYGTYPHMVVMEYLDFFARAHGLPAPARTKAVAGIMDFCQLNDLAEKPVSTLSKGMKQRLCLGRCLIHDPQVLILDEPSAGLDPRARIEFRELLRLLAQQGKAIFISSHILAELDELCDAVAIIELGRIVVEGRIADIRARLRDRQARHNGAGGRMVDLRLSTPHERTAALLAEQPDCHQVRIEENAITLAFAGTDADLAALLKRLVQAGLPVCHCAAREEDLEDVFMQVTEGKVQ